MHDAGGMCRCQGIGHLNAKSEHLGQCEWSICDFLVHAGAGEELHHDEIHFVGGFNRMNRHDARMIERGRRARLLDEAPAGRAVPIDLAGENLDGHGSAQLRVHRLEDFAHTARADLLDDLVVEELLVGLNGTHDGNVSVVNEVCTREGPVTVKVYVSFSATRYRPPP